MSLPMLVWRNMRKCFFGHSLWTKNGLFVHLLTSLMWMKCLLLVYRAVLSPEQLRDLFLTVTKPAENWDQIWFLQNSIHAFNPHFRLYLFASWWVYPQQQRLLVLLHASSVLYWSQLASLSCLAAIFSSLWFFFPCPLLLVIGFRLWNPNPKNLPRVL